MNVNTRELVDFNQYSAEERDRMIGNGFHEVPPELQKEATKKLKGRKSVQTRYTSSNKLAQWAERVRQNQQNGKTY